MENNEINQNLLSTEQQLLTRIVAKGGMMGSFAKLFFFDSQKAKQYILECSEQCHNQGAIDCWGEELVKDIKIYSEVMNKKKVHET